MIAAPALMLATPSSMISLTKTGIRAGAYGVQAPLSATLIRLFLAMFALGAALAARSPAYQEIECGLLLYRPTRQFSDASAPNLARIAFEDQR
jgi:hypothetical protein